MVDHKGIVRAAVAFQAWNNLSIIYPYASKHNWVEQLWKTTFLRTKDLPGKYKINIVQTVDQVYSYMTSMGHSTPPES